MHHFPDGAPSSTAIAKAQAKRLRSALTNAIFSLEEIGHSQALELIAKTHGFESWGHLNAALSEEEGAEHVTTEDEKIRGPGDKSDPTLVNVTLHFIWNGFHWNAGISGHQVAKIMTILGRVLNSSEFDVVDLTDGEKRLAYDASPRWMVRKASVHALFQRFEEDPDARGMNPATRRCVLDTLLGIAKAAQSGPFISEKGTKIPIGYFRGTDMVEFDINKNDVPERDRAIDRKHSLLVADSIDDARRAVRAVSQNVVDLTDPSFDSRVLCRLWELPDIKFSNPIDAIMTLAAVKCANGLYLSKVVKNPQDGKYFGPIVVLIALRQYQESGCDVLLAQARSLGLHICTWLDSSYYDRPKLSDVIVSNSAGLMEIKPEDKKPKVWRHPNIFPYAKERPKGILKRRIV